MLERILHPIGETPAQHDWFSQCPRCGAGVERLVVTRIYVGGRGYVGYQNCTACGSALGDEWEIGAQVRAQREAGES